MKYTWQDNQWAMLSGLIQSKKMPHAILLHGNVGIGKKDFATHLAKTLLCSQPSATGEACNHCESCNVVNAQTHPDLMVLKPLPPEKSKSKTPVLSIKVDAIRGFCKKLNHTSQFGGYRVAIIEDADAMVTSASNGLLKTLEEPGADVVILLVSSKPEKLPITIRSRCRKIRFDLPENDLAIAWLDNNVNKNRVIKDSQLALNMAHGAPLLANAFDDARVQQRTLLTKAFSAKINKEVSINYAAKLSSLPKASALDWVVDWVSDLIKLKTCTDKVNIVNSDCEASLLRIANIIDNRAIYQFYDQVFESRKYDVIALNPQLFWENLLISWDNL